MQGAANIVPLGSGPLAPKHGPFEDIRMQTQFPETCKVFDASSLQNRTRSPAEFPPRVVTLTHHPFNTLQGVGRPSCAWQSCSNGCLMERGSG